MQPLTIPEEPGSERCRTAFVAQVILPRSDKSAGARNSPLRRGRGKTVLPILPSSGRKRIVIDLYSDLSFGRLHRKRKSVIRSNYVGTCVHSWPHRAARPWRVLRQRLSVTQRRSLLPAAHAIFVRSIPSTVRSRW